MKICGKRKQSKTVKALLSSLFQVLFLYSYQIAIFYRGMRKEVRRDGEEKKDRMTGKRNRGKEEIRGGGRRKEGRKEVRKEGKRREGRRKEEREGGKEEENVELRIV